MTENSRDITACSKELRALIGDDIARVDMKAEIAPPPKIEFVLYDPSKKDLEGEPLEDQPGQ